MKKNIINKMLLALVSLMFITSCADREMTIVDTEQSPILLDLSTESLYLDENFPNNNALTLSWDAADYGAPLEVTYVVEVSATSTFDTVAELGTATKSATNISFTNKQMNEASSAIGLTPYVEQTMYFRVISYIGSPAGTEQVSEITSLAITPYQASPTYEYTDLFLIGDATAGGWDNNETNANLFPLMKTTSTSVYTFTGYFKVGGFKLIEVKGSWDDQYGYAGTDGTLSTDGGSGNIPVTTAGYYTLSIDTSALTYTLVAVDEPTTTYGAISIIGSVNGDWDTDTAMTQSSFDSHMWVLSSAALSSGEFKFRADNAWDVNWGSDSEYYGTATIGGANIPISSAWDYNVYFNDSTGNYTIIPIK